MFSLKNPFEFLFLATSILHLFVNEYFAWMVTGYPLGCLASGHLCSYRFCSPYLVLLKPWKIGNRPQMEQVHCNSSATR